MVKVNYISFNNCIALAEKFYLGFSQAEMEKRIGVANQYMVM